MAVSKMNGEVGGGGHSLGPNVKVGEIGRGQSQTRGKARERSSEPRY